MVKVSDFSSLIFREYVNEGITQTKEYIQFFSADDNICVQLIVSQNNVSVFVENIKSGSNHALIPYTVQIEDGFSLTYEVKSLGLEVGNYLFKIQDSQTGYIYKSCKFDIVSDECLKDSVKITYTNYRNEFNSYFYSNKQHYFDVRFKGAILIRDIELLSEDELFRGQDYSNNLLSGFPYFTNKLTIGNYEGVPVWIGQKVNFAFSLTEVMLNDKYITRSGNIEKIELMPSNPMFVYKIGFEWSEQYLYGIDSNNIEMVTNTGLAMYTNTGIKMQLNN